MQPKAYGCSSVSLTPTQVTWGTEGNQFSSLRELNSTLTDSMSVVPPHRRFAFFAGFIRSNAVAVTTAGPAIEIRTRAV